jgi:catechol 2,3-dioxygenase-like lactoylglutathione lyase family enzyme
MKMVSTVLDTTDPRALAEFYRDLLGWSYRPGDEPPPPGEPDQRGREWLVLRSPGGGPQLAFQKTDQLARSTWPDSTVPQQLHLDFAVPTEEELRAEHDHALRLGARVLLDRTDDPDEPLWVFADLAGHPFCIFVSPDAG